MTNTGPELQLPAPVGPNVAAEQAGLPALSAPEQAPAAPERLSIPLPPNPAAAVAQVAPIAAPAPQMAAQPDVSATTSVVVPNAADDQDLIEKEWVAKAKQIVEKTRNDPYQQSKELTVFKSDYIQKRYNKTIRMSE